MTWLLILLIALAVPSAAPRPDAPAAPEDDLVIAISREGKAAPLPPVTPARRPGAPLVVIDPGHGGRDPGARSADEAVSEAEVTLALALAIRDALAATGRVRAALTREDDRFLALQDRYEIARRLGADLFISIHADAAPASDLARGATVYTLSEVASDQEAAAFAARENESDVVAGARLSPDPQVNLILVDLALRQSIDTAGRFARLIHREASASVPFRPQWHRFAAFVVLRAPDIPSVLFESGYLTNDEDAAFLQSEEGRRRIADGLRRAIEAHFAQRSLDVAALHRPFWLG